MDAPRPPMRLELEEEPDLGWVTVSSMVHDHPEMQNSTKTHSLVDAGLMKLGPSAGYEVVAGDSLGKEEVYFPIPLF